MFFSKDIYTCVDIGSYAIKIAQIKKTGEKEFKIIDTVMQKIPRETVVDGIIKDESLMAAEIKSLINMLKKKANYIITAVPSNELLIRNIEMPKMEEKEIRESLKWEADEQLPYPVENAAIDYLKIDENEEGVEYLISAVKKNIVDNYLSPFERINLKVDVVNIQPMALISLLEYQEEIEGNVAVIDIGTTASQVTIANKNNIILSRTIDTGGQQFTKTLMEIDGSEFNDAEENKIKYGLDAENAGKEDASIEAFQLDSAIGEDKRLETLADSLASEITRSFNYFNIKKRGEEISKVFITGGGAKIKGLNDFISKELGREIEVLDTFKNTTYKNKNEDYCREKNNEFAVAIGLGISEVMANES
jgi:type IV pilus assembly protein PilM